MSETPKKAAAPVPAKKPSPQSSAKKPASQSATNKIAPKSNAPIEEYDDEEQLGLVAGMKYWFLHEAPSWMVSTLVHMVLFLIMALVMGTVQQVTKESDAPAFEAAKIDTTELPEIKQFELGDPQIDPTELNTESLQLEKYDPVAKEAQINDNSKEFEEKGGGTISPNDSIVGGGTGTFSVDPNSLGPLSKGSGLESGGGFGNNAGKGGDGAGFAGRGAGKRDAVAGGGTKDTERAVGAALNWIARHQDKNGGWSIAHDPNCRGIKCSGNGSQVNANAAATAMGLLPFLASGQTHMSKGPYQKNIQAGIAHLIKNQGKNGSYAPNSRRNEFYEHGLATIAMCEVFGMTQDSRVGLSAQSAIDYIEASQGESGGWRYEPNPPDTDTSVVGWQIMALKSGMMAGLKVNQEKLDKAKKDLKRASSGYKGGKYGYVPRSGARPSCTAIGLLCMQYMGAPRTDAGINEGVEYLMKNLPEKDGKRDIYYWYYATQVLHNMPGDDWEKWNRKMRRVLVETQERGGCKEGSWDPETDEWGDAGGRLFVTSLSCLTLEVYYRYLPLYKLDGKEDKKEVVLAETEEPSKEDAAKAEPKQKIEKKAKKGKAE